jgi:Ca-activated chloride channel family protein
MTFHWPHVLWLLAIPALLWWRRARRDRARTENSAHPQIVRAWASPERLEPHPSHHDLNRDQKHLGRLWLALALGIVALARPQWGPNNAPVVEQSREIIVALDLSRSMLTEDVRPSRLAHAKLLLASFLEQLAGERVGLIVFSGTAFLQSPLSSDYEILREFLPALDPGYLPENGSDFDQMLATAATAFSPDEADRYLVILSDGEAQPGDWSARLPALKAKGVRVIALGIGTATGGNIPLGDGKFLKDATGAVVVSKLQPASLQELARATDGTYRDANRWIDVPRLLRATAERPHTHAAQKPGEQKHADRFAWFLVPALLLAGWSGWCEFPLRLHTKERSRPAPPASRGRPAVAAAALLLICAVILPRARTAETAATKPIEQALVDLLQQVAARPSPTPKDYADLVRHYVAYGQKLRHSVGAVPPEIARDAWRCLNAGRALAPRATDWEMLQRELTALAKKSDDTPKADPTAEPGQNDAEKNGEREATERDRESGGGKRAAVGAQPTEDGDPADPKDGESAPGQSRQVREAFGAADPNSDAADLEPTEANAPTPPPSKQVVTRLSASLVLPLHKLDELRRTSSPVELFLLMRDRAKTPPGGNPQSW